MPRGRPLVPLTLTDEQQDQLNGIAHSATLPYALVQRAGMILASAEGSTNAAVARRVGVTPQTVGKWRRRFRAAGIQGLHDELRRVRLFFVGGRISLCGSEAGGNWIRHGVVREQRRGPVADGTCAVSDGWGCSAGTRALGGGSQYASMRRRPVAA